MYTTCVHTVHLYPGSTRTAVHTCTPYYTKVKIFYVYHLYNSTDSKLPVYLYYQQAYHTCVLHVCVHMYHTTTQTTCSNHIRRPLWTTQIIKCLCFKTFWSSPSTWFCFVSFQTYVFGYNLIHIVVRTTIMWI